MPPDLVFKQRKEAFVKRLHDELARGLVDFDIADFLVRFNELAEDYYTTSSCSGRIILAETRRLALAKSSHEFKFIKKWHRPVTVQEILRELEGKSYENVWLLVRAPIIHFAAKNMELALRLLRLAQNVGFKHSGIISVREDGEVIVEVQADDRLDLPLIIQGRWVVNRDRLQDIVELANETLMIGKLRLVNLIGVIEQEILRRVEFKPIELSKIRMYREFTIDEAKACLLAEDHTA